MAVMEITTPKQIAERGDEIYRTKYKSAFEQEHLGKFVAIDVLTENPYIGESAEDALNAARLAAPRGVFHLIKVGSAGAFRVSYSRHGNVDWLV